MAGETAKLPERVVLVTGGSSGLGAHIAQAFGEQPGTQVVICGRDPRKLADQQQALAEKNIPCAAIQADLSKSDEVRNLLEQIRRDFQRLDVLVNNVGRSTRGRAIDVDPDQFQEFWEANFLSAVHCTQQAYPLLKESQGSIVFIGSLASKMASPFLGAYPASKFPLAAYAQQLRLELEPDNIHVLLVCPGPLRRDDAGERYAAEAKDLPASASRPGGGVRIRGLDPQMVAQRIVQACRRKTPELILPGKARLLLAISALFPSWGDWLIKRYTR